MKAYASVLLLVASLLQFGCAHDEVNSGDITPLAPGESAVVVGISMFLRPAIGIIGPDRAPLQGGFITYDPATRQRTGTFMLNFAQYCQKSAACEGGVAYHMYKLPPGKYALGWAYHHGMYLSYATFQSYKLTVSARGGDTLYRREFSEVAKLTPTTPTFEVGPGEVVYLGNLTFDFTNYGRLFMLSGDLPKAREAIAASGAADRLTNRPLGGETSKIITAPAKYLEEKF